MAMVGEAVNTVLAGVNRQDVVTSDDGWRAFLTGLAGAIQQDLEAAVAAATTQAAEAATEAAEHAVPPQVQPVQGFQGPGQSEFNSKVFTPGKFADQHGEQSFPQWREDVPMFCRRNRKDLCKAIGAVERLKLPIEIPKLQQELERIDADLLRSDFDIARYGLWLHDDLKMLTTGQARSIADSTREEPGSGIIGCAKLNERFWSNDQRGLTNLSSNAMNFPRPKALKDTCMAKLDLGDRIREWERVANEPFQVEMKKTALLRVLPEHDERRLLDLNMDVEKLSPADLEARIDLFGNNHNTDATTGAIVNLDIAAFLGPLLAGDTPDNEITEKIKAMRDLLNMESKPEEPPSQPDHSGWPALPQHPQEQVPQGPGGYGGDVAAFKGKGKNGSNGGKGTCGGSGFKWGILVLWEDWSLAKTLFRTRRRQRKRRCEGNM